MADRIISFSPPDISQLEIDEVVNALKSGWITTGPRTKQLEKKIARWFNVGDNCVCMNSQTACAEMALRLMGIGPGDEVITTAYTYTATASVINHVGAKIVLVDCEKGGFNIDLCAVEQAITQRTKAIIPVDIGGIPCDYDRLFDIIKSKKHLFSASNKLQEAIGRVFVLEDGAHAFGASYKDKMIGSVADFTAFSFHAVKNYTTAEGGALTWKSINGIDDAEIYRQLNLLILHGQSKDALSKTQAGAWEYDVLGTYYKCNMTDIAAAMGLAQFARYPQLLEKRKETNLYYDSIFKPLGLNVPKHYTSTYQSTGHLYIARVPNIAENERNQIIKDMAQRGISCNVHFKPLPLLTAYKNMGFDINNFPNAYNQYKNAISLPNHTCLTQDDIKYVADNFVAAAGKYLK